MLFSIFSFSQSYKVKLDEMIELYNDEDNKYITIANELISNNYGKIDNETKFYCEYFLGYDLIIKEEYKKALDKYMDLLVFCEQNTVNDSYGNIRKCKKDIKSRIKSLEIIIANLPNEVPINNDFEVTSAENLNKNIIEETQKNENDVEKNSVNEINTTVTEQKISNTENKTVTLTVSGTGKTFEEAKNNALRSAIEQAFGVFISTNTEILNDNLVKDEIVSISSGNVQKYNVVSQVELPNVGNAITLNATVSIDKLTSFAESKGVVVEFKGGLFAQNIKIQRLNEESELIAIINLCTTSLKILLNSFDYDLDTNEPTEIGDYIYNYQTIYNDKYGLYYRYYNKNDFKIDFNITANSNNYLSIFHDNFEKTLIGLSMNVNEVLSYKKLNKKIVALTFNEKKYFLRNIKSLELLNNLFRKSQCIPLLFKISSKIDTYNNLINNGFYFYKGAKKISGLKFDSEIYKSLSFLAYNIYYNDLGPHKNYFSLYALDIINGFNNIDNEFLNYNFSSESFKNSIPELFIEKKDYTFNFSLTRYYTLNEIENIDTFKVEKINVFEDISREIARQKEIEYIVLRGLEENEITNIDGSKYVSDRYADPIQEFLKNNSFRFEIVEKNKDYYIIKTEYDKLLKLKYPPKHPY